MLHGAGNTILFLLSGRRGLERGVNQLRDYEIPPAARQQLGEVPGASTLLEALGQVGVTLAQVALSVVHVVPEGIEHGGHGHDALVPLHSRQILHATATVGVAHRAVGIVHGFGLSHVQTTVGSFGHALQVGGIPGGCG